MGGRARGGERGGAAGRLAGAGESLPLPASLPATWGIVDSKRLLSKSKAKRLNWFYYIPNQVALALTPVGLTGSGSI